jgi:hypothetical protein
VDDGKPLRATHTFTRLTKGFVSYTNFDHEKFNGCSQGKKHRHKFIHAKTLAKITAPFRKHNKLITNLKHFFFYVLFVGPPWKQLIFIRNRGSRIQNG